MHAVEEWDLKMLFGLWNYHFKFFNFKYEEPKLDFVDIDVKFGQIDKYQEDLKMIKLLFPTLKQWKIETTVDVDTWIMPKETTMMLDLEDVMFKVHA